MAISLDKTTCPNCGNTLTFNPETQSLGCDLCSQVADIQEKDIENIKYNIIPFQLSPKQIEDLFYEWLVNTNTDTPFDMIDNMCIDFIHGQYYPAWTFKVLDNKTGREFNVLKYAGGKEYVDEAAIQVLGFSKFQPLLVKPYEEKYTMGFDIIPMGIGKETAWQEYVQAQGQKIIDYRLKSEIIFCYIPIWTIKYTYKNKEYVFYMEGIAGTMKRGSVPVEPFIVERRYLRKSQIVSRYILVLSLIAIIVTTFGAMALSAVVIALLAALVSSAAFFYYSFILAFVKTKRKEDELHKKLQYALTLYLAEKR